MAEPQSVRTVPNALLRLPTVAAVTTAVSGGTALAGWIFGIDALKGLGGPITMKANMAVALIACGLALLIVATRARGLSPIAAILALLAGTIGALTIAEHLGGWNLGIDELLFDEHAGAAATVSPGRIGPNGSISLVLAALSMLGLLRGTPGSIARAQVLSSAQAVLALVALTGYLYGVPELYAIARVSGIAFPTAATLLILSVGMLTVRLDTGPVMALTGAGSGGVMARRLLLPAVAMPLVLGYLRLAGQRAHLFDTEFGFALFAISLAGVFVVLIWRTARLAEALDHERQVSEDAMRVARESAEEANHLKDQFLATLSHELRTPLTAILGYTRMLRSGAIPPEKRERAVEIIERNAVAQNMLVEDLLDLSRITAGRLRLDVHPVPVTLPLREALESVRPAAEGKRIAIDVDIEPDAGLVNADPARLQQIFWNLFSNAIKFTPSGGRLAVAVDTEEGWTRVIVRDTGIGITREFLPHLFEPFRQADGRFTREYGGLGLGLAICRQLVEQHGGTIEADSDGPGTGATFTVRLPPPADAEAAAVAAGAQTISDPPSASAPRHA
jgi:signal transduction histidine kinase